MRYTRHCTVCESLRPHPLDRSIPFAGICALTAFPIVLLVVTMRSHSAPPEAGDPSSGSFDRAQANLAALSDATVQEVRALREQWDTAGTGAANLGAAAVNNAIRFAPLPELNASSDNPVWERKRKMIGSDVRDRTAPPALLRSPPSCGRCAPDSIVCCRSCRVFFPRFVLQLYSFDRASLTGACSRFCSAPHPHTPIQPCTFHRHPPTPTTAPLSPFPPTHRP